MSDMTFAARLFAIRAALGEGPRKPLSLRALDDLIAETTGRRIHASELSRLETGDRRPLLEDVEAIAAVDPQKRGPAWLAFGVLPAPPEEEGGEAEPAPEPRRPAPPLARDDGASRETLFHPPERRRRA